MNKIKLMNDKKGTSLGDMYPAVLTIILIGIVIGIGIFILSETSDAISNTLTTVHNETILLLNETADDVDTASDCGASDFEVSYITDELNATTLTAANYTFSTLGSLLATVASEYGAGAGTNVNITYTYRSGDTSTTGYCGVMETASDGVGNFATWIAVIVVVLAAAIVLGIVLTSFGRRNSV